MSCGGAGWTSCEEVLAEVWLFLDNESHVERRTMLRRHLDECGTCLEHYGIEEHLKELLQRKCGGEHAPAELRERLRTSIRETVLKQADVTVEYGPEGTSVEIRSKI